MEQPEMVALIRAGVPKADAVWADLGAGTGNFTWALRELLGPDGSIYAVDRDGKAIRSQQARLASAVPGATIYPQQADFTRPLTLPPLDGVLMANALHFIRDQSALLAHIAGYLRPSGRLLLVEYDLHFPIPWVPFPVSFARLRTLIVGTGFGDVEQIGRRVSPSSGTAMYAAVAVRL